jgi:hypothetical protein
MGSGGVGCGVWGSGVWGVGKWGVGKWGVGCGVWGVGKWGSGEAVSSPYHPKTLSPYLLPFAFCMSAFCLLISAIS